MSPGAFSDYNPATARKCHYSPVAASDTVLYAEERRAVRTPRTYTTDAAECGECLASIPEDAYYGFDPFGIRIIGLSARAGDNQGRLLPSVARVSRPPPPTPRARGRAPSCGASFGDLLIHHVAKTLRSPRAVSGMRSARRPHRRVALDRALADRDSLPPPGGSGRRLGDRTIERAAAFNEDVP